MLILIAGCGRLGSKLAETLSVEGHDVVVIANADELKRLGNNFDGLAIAGNPIDEDILKKAGIEKADAVFSVTADDNINVMVAQIAKNLFNVSLVLARISDPKRDIFYKKLGLDTVCPTNSGINKILKYIQEHDCFSLQGYLDSRVFSIKPTTDWIGGCIREIALPQNLKLVGVLRESNIIYPKPEVNILASDSLIFIKK